MRRFKRFTCVLLCLLLLICTLPFRMMSAVAEETTATAAFAGEGTEESPYLISTKEDLRTLSDLINNPETAEAYYNKCYKQTTDIDLENEPFQPIGYWREDATKCSFYGLYQGNYHKITGLYVENTKGGAGLFSTLTGAVRNLSVYGKIVADDVQGGGIASTTHNGKIVNCSFNGVITSENNSYIGGIIGRIWRAGTIEGCYFNGTLDSDGAGGIVGVAYAGYEDYVQQVSINNCYATGIIESSNENIGGIIRKAILNNEESTITYSNNYYLSTLAPGGVNGKTAVGCTKLVEIGLKACADMLGSPFIDNNWTNGFNDGYPIFEWQMMPYQFVGEGTEENPYRISSKEELKEMRDMINDEYKGTEYCNRSYILMADIDLENESWTPIGKAFKDDVQGAIPYFAGHFNGNNHVIRGLNVNETTKFAGLFGAINDESIVENLVVYGTVESIAQCVGGIVGELRGEYSKIQNCAFIGDVSGSKSVGGIVGNIFMNGYVNNCYHNGSVTASENSGGIAGRLYAYNDSEISVKNCYHVGIVTAESNSGAVVGISAHESESYSIAVKKCYYLKSEHANGINGDFSESSTISLSESMLRQVASELGTPFVLNADTNFNNGYPVFYWQLSSELIGDINNDGIISVVDAVVLQKHLLNIEPLNSLKAYAADINQDSIIDAFDLVFLKRMLLAS